MRPGFYPILILWLVKGILSAVIPTSQKTSISPYSFPLGMIDPQIHYSFYKDCKNIAFGSLDSIAYTIAAFQKFKKFKFFILFVQVTSFKLIWIIVTIQLKLQNSWRREIELNSSLIEFWINFWHFSFKINYKPYEDYDE